jgi:hypothetical protein
MRPLPGISLILVIAATLSIPSCKKEEGPQGPAGPAGNANVKSQIITLSSSDWIGGGYGYEAAMPCSIITQDIAEKGAVLCYLRVGDNYFPIPYSIDYGNWTTHFLFGYNVGNALFMVQDTDGETPNPGTKEFKVVTIASASMSIPAELDVNDYNAVKEYYQLRD